MGNVCVCVRCNGIKNTGASIVHCFLVCHSGRVASLALRVFIQILRKHTASVNRQRASWVTEKGHRSFSIFCDCQALQRRVVRPQSLGISTSASSRPRRPSAQARPSGGQTRGGKRRLKNRMKGNPHCERASRVRVYMFGGLLREGC